MKNTSLICSRLFSATLLLVALTLTSNSNATEFSVPVNLAKLIDEGQTTNQELKAIQDIILGLEDEASAAGALDDPRIGIGILNLPTDSFKFDQEPMTQKTIAFSQRFPWLGKLDLKSQAVMLKALRLKAELRAKRLKLTRNISESYFELAFIDSSLRTNSQLTDMVTQLLKVSESRYAVGKGLQQDVLQAQVELSKLLDEKLTLMKKRKVIESRINELINRPRFHPVNPVVDLKIPNSDLNDDALKWLALSNNPLIEARQIGIKKSDVDISLAKKDYYPNFDLKVAYGQRDDDEMGQSRSDFVSGLLTMTVPLWSGSKQDKNLSSARKKNESAKKSYQNLVDTIPHQVTSVTEEIRTLKKNFGLYQEGLLVQAEQWANSSLSAYEVGKVEFNTMISSQIRLARLQLQADNYRYAIFQKYAELEEILGGPQVAGEAQDLPKDGQDPAQFRSKLQGAIQRRGV